MGLSKNITLTIKDYEIKLDKEIKFYENDTIDLCFSILEYGIEVKDGISINKLMPIQALRSYMLIETPHGIDYAESTKIEDNKIVFNLGTKYSQFVGVGRMQIVVKDSDGCRVTLPEFEFEIKESINMNWDRESFDFLATEDESIIIDEFGRKIHMSKISDMPESENLSEESYAMIIDEEGNKRFKVRAIADAVEDSLDAKFNAYTDELSGDVEEFKGSVRTDITTLTNENNTFKNQVNTRLADYGSNYNSFKDNVEARLGEHMTDYNRFKDGVETKMEESENAYDGFVSNVSTVLDSYGSTYNAFKNEVNKANASFQSTLNASNQAFKNEMVDRYDNFVYKIDEDIFEGGRTDYFGKTHETIGERLELDFDNVHRRIDEGELLDYEGCAITADSSYYGLQRETKVQGRTLQNLWNLEILHGVTKNGNEYTTTGETTTWCRPLQSTLLSIGDTYTVIFEAKTTIDKANIRLDYLRDGIASGIIEGAITPNQYTLFKVTSTLQYEGLVFNIRDTYGGVVSVRNVMLLKGDHTQTPLEELPYIEGIESVGDKSKNLVKSIVVDMEHSDGTYVRCEGTHTSRSSIIKLPKGKYSLSFEKFDYSELKDGGICIWDNTESTTWKRKSPTIKNFEILEDEVGITWYGSFSTKERKDEVVGSFIQIEEGETVTPYQEHYDGYKISGKSCGKNLWSYKKEIELPTVSNLSWFDINGKSGIHGTDVLSKTNTWVYLPKGTYYLGSEKSNCDLQIINTNGDHIKLDSTWEGGLISLRFKPLDITQPLYARNIIISSSSTTFEPYQESTYSYTLNEPLRSLPSGVCDTIDLETGVLTRRVGKAVLDGTQKQWTIDTASPLIEGTLSFDNQRDFGLGKKFNYGDKTGMICDKFPSCSREGLLNNKGGISDYNGGFRIRIKTENLETEDVQGFIKWLSSNPVTVYYELNIPTTEQLSEQRINSFDGITHVISDNKIMSKITTRIPTDLGNNVNNRLNNLNNKIGNACVDYFGYDHPSLQDRLMSDFDKLNTKIEGYGYISYEGTSIYATNTMKGSVNNTVVKGKTLHNILIDGGFQSAGSSTGGTVTVNTKDEIKKTIGSVGSCVFTKDLKVDIVKDRTYTAIFEYFCTDTTLSNVTVSYHGTTAEGVGTYRIGAREVYFTDGTKYARYMTTLTITSENTPKSLCIGYHGGMKEGTELGVKNVILLEGDHTQTPIEELPFVEGIESVGESELTDDSYKISGKSCGKNLFNKENMEISDLYVPQGQNNIVKAQTLRGFIMKIIPNTNYVLSKGYRVEDCLRVYGSVDYPIANGNAKSLAYGDGSNQVAFNTGQFKYIFCVCYTNKEGGNVDEAEIRKIFDTIQLEESTKLTPYEPYKESTYSYILDEPLRSLPNGVCDEIDLTTGALTRRVGKVVLDGTESDYSAYAIDGSQNTETTTIFRYDYYEHCPCWDNTKNAIVDTMPIVGSLLYGRPNCGYASDTTSFVFRIEKSKLETLDVHGFKKWLQANPTTIFYELKNPTTEQLTPQQLKSFDATTHIISDNKLMPIVSTKIPTDLGAMVNTLSLRNGELEEINKEQDELIDITMMATDEMYSMLEPLMEAVEPMGLLDCSKMAQMYVAMVQRGIKKIEDVPRRYQEEVREVLGIKIEEEEWGEDDGIK